AARAEQIGRLENILNEMDDVDREVIALRHFEELSNAETAEVLQIETSAASKRYLRAMTRLSQLMEKHQETIQPSSPRSIACDGTEEQNSAVPEPRRPDDFRRGNS
ncbi:MAG: sigma factor-like helix-turn-helix DNA-binding protein, partial [Rubripirellula sp.]